MDSPYPRVMRLKHCDLRAWEWGCETVFPDGTSVPSTPHDTAHYHVISHRCGFGDDLNGYCLSHDLMHSLTQEWFYDRPSEVLWAIAHGQMLSGRAAASEEIVAQVAQRWVWANEQPIIGGVGWSAFKARALELWGA